MTIHEKSTVLIVNIPEREESLKFILNKLINQVHEIRIVFNDYESIPEWTNSYDKLRCYYNKELLTSNSIWIAMEDISDGFIFTCDDDIDYPDDYIETMINKSKFYDNKCIITMYAEVANRPPTTYSYLELETNRIRRTLKAYLCFDDENNQDLFVDIAGVGCSMFHSSILSPKLEDFPDIYCRDLWFAVLAAKNKIPIVRIASPKNWLKKIENVQTRNVHEIWRSNNKFIERREEIYKNILVPLLNDFGPIEKN